MSTGYNIECYSVILMFVWFEDSTWNSTVREHLWRLSHYFLIHHILWPLRAFNMSDIFLLSFFF